MTGVALIYVRRSMVRYEADRSSPERQLANCMRVCEQKIWRELTGPLVDARRARRDSNPRSHRFEVCGSIH